MKIPERIRENQGAIAWAGLIGAVLVYEYICDEGMMLSECVDRALERPVVREVTAFAIGSTALHLLNVVPPQYDWIHQLGEVKDLIRGRDVRES